MLEQYGSNVIQRNEIEKYFKDNNIDLESLRDIAYQLQKKNDLLLGGLRSSNVKSFRNTIVFNESDSLDADYPFIMDFEVMSETIKIVSVNVSFKIKKFRAYSKAGAETGTPSGGGSTPTSSSGGASTPTSGSGGGQTSSGGSGGQVPGVTYGLTIDGTGHVTGYGSVTVASNNHTHTVSNHTHTVTIANHTHTVTIPNHTHSNHTHNAVYGIYEEETSPTIGVSISRDDGATYGAILGTYTSDVANLEIKDYITKVGSYLIKFSSSVRCRISARVLLKLDIKAR